MSHVATGIETIVALTFALRLRCASSSVMNVEWPSGELAVAVAASLWAQRLMAEPDHHAGLVRHRWRLERARRARPPRGKGRRVTFYARESIDAYLACSRMRRHDRSQSSGALTYIY